VADPITDAWNALMRGDALCLLGVMAVVVMLLVLFIALHMMRIRKEQSWAHNPDKTFKPPWRRG